VQLVHIAAANVVAYDVADWGFCSGSHFGVGVWMLSGCDSDGDHRVSCDL
jgi:hypothetical protein